MFYIDKLYDHTLGWSTCFRQPLADSHCKDPHGYPLAFRLRFGAMVLDQNNWVLDFGGLKPIKARLADEFDHRTVLAADDPFLPDFQALYAKCGFRDILVLPFVGCEAFAQHAYGVVDEWLHANYLHSIDARGLHIKSVTVHEHPGNAAIFEGGTFSV